MAPAIFFASASSVSSVVDFELDGYCHRARFTLGESITARRGCQASALLRAPNGVEGVLTRGHDQGQVAGSRGQ